MVAIEQNVDIPADRRLRPGLVLPETFKPGSTLRLEIVPPEGHEANWKAAFPLEFEETVKPLYGLFESDGHELDRFLEEKHRDKNHEDEIDTRAGMESKRYKGR
jgi:hypothetical protein